MISIKTFTVNPLQENCYVVSDETQECVVIDCGAYYDTERSAIVNYLKDNALKPVHLLCTHGHFDHAFGNDTIYAEYGLKPEIHAADAHFIANLSRQCDEMDIGIGYSRQSPPVGTLLADGDVVSFGTHRLQVIHTPGHSPGGLCFYCAEEKVVFTGDTLFHMSVGRTDLPGGSWQELAQSLAQRLSVLPPDTVAYPGHGPRTMTADTMRVVSQW